MLVLAIDTALEACSAALLDSRSGTLLASESVPMTRGHAEALMPMIGRVMDEAALPFADLDRIAVTTGPGSFTGLRVGIAAARGIALAAGKPAIGLSTFAAFAAPHVAKDETTPVAAAVDARHEHVYLQVFGTGGRTTVPPCIVSLHEAAKVSAVDSVRIAGTGAAQLAKAWPQDAPQPALVDQRSAPDILWVARLGAAAPESRVPPKPLYLRAPRAQPQDAAHLPRR
jgi:tRNA threonylcarbamoyl adenosine modification protein YeaZ